MHTCLVDIRGVVGFHASESGLAALFVDGRAARLASPHGGAPVILPPHVAALAVDLQDPWVLHVGGRYLSPAERASAVFRVPSRDQVGPRERALFWLDRQELTFGPGSGPRAALDARGLPIPAIEGTLDPAVLGPQPPPSLLARARFDHGVALAGDISETLWEVRGPQDDRPAGPGQQFANGVRVRCDFETHFVVHVTPFDPASDARWELVLSGTSAPLYLYNREFAAIASRWRRSGLEGVPDHDFELLYELCSPQPAVRAIPRVVAGPDDRGDETRCMPGSFR